MENQNSSTAVEEPQFHIADIHWVYKIIVVVVFLVLLRISFAASNPVATIDIPTGNVSVTQGTAVSFSGSGTTGAGVPAGTRTDYTMGPVTEGIAFDSSTNSIWISNYSGANTVKKINASTGAIVGTYTLGASPYGIAFDPSTNSMWVTNYSGAALVTKVNAATGAVIGTYPVGSTAFGVAFDPSTNSIWVTNSASNTVTKLRASDGAVLGTYATGQHPWGIAYDSATNSIWITNYSSANSVTKLNAATGALIGTYAVGASPYGIAFDPLTNSMWVANAGSNTVKKLNTANGAVLGSYTLASFFVYGVTFDSSTNSIWVTNANNAVKINPVNGATLATYAVGTSPHQITFDASTNSVWTTNSGSNTVSKISTGVNSITAYEWREGDCSTGALLSSSSSFNLATPVSGTRTVYLRVKDATGVWSTNCPARTVTVTPIASIDVPTSDTSTPQGQVVAFSGSGITTGVPAGTRTDYPVSSAPSGVAFDPVTSSVWVANYSANTVSKVNVSTGTKTNYAAGAGPWGVAFDSITNSIWVTNWTPNSVSKFNINTGARTDYPVGSHPDAIAFDPVTSSVWVANYSSSSISKVDINTGAKVDYTVGGLPDGVAFDPVTNSVWVTSYNSNIVSKMDINTGTRTDYAVGAGPWGAVFDPVTNSVWVVNYSASTVSKVDIFTGTRVDYAVGNLPVGITFDAGTNSVWVTNYNVNTVSKVDIFTGTRVDYAVGSHPYAVAVDAVTNSAWVANFSSGSVSKLSTGANPTMAYEWREGDCNTGALLSSDPNFNYSSLVTGVHAVYFRTQDSLGTWSNNCPSRVVTVTAGVVNGVCGAAHHSTFSSEPTTDLCSMGSSTAVTGGATGPWYWDCNGLNGGTNDSCNAFTSVIAGSCGSADGTPTPIAPTTNLCSYTSASPTVTGSGPWNWTCFGSNGGANESCSAPQSSVCGDASCETGENFLTCPQDCKIRYQEF